MANPSKLPAAQYLSSENVIESFYQHGMKRIQKMSTAQIVILSMMAGGFITMGALFSVLLAQGIEAEGPKRLIQGFAFTAGFFSVILSSAILFTEVNVILPATLIHVHDRSILLKVARFWLLTWIGNLAGALLFGWMVNAAQFYPPEIYTDLSHFVAKKMHYAEVGTPTAWFQAMLSGAIANWLVGMAAFFTTMGRTIFGKYIPVFLLVCLFVAGNFQHSPANMGYFSLSISHGDGPGWMMALLWNIIPVGIGNVLGGAFLVSLPFWYGLRGADADSDGSEE